MLYVDSVSEAIISKKAKRLHNDLIKLLPGISKSVVSDFKANRSCFENFKNYSDIHSDTRHFECVSSDKGKFEIFVAEFKDYVGAQGFISKHDFKTSSVRLVT